MAGDEVLFAPVSTQIRCKQGILQGKLRVRAWTTNFEAGNRCATVIIRAIPYAD